jgi:hypothetical protein
MSDSNAVLALASNDVSEDEVLTEDEVLEATLVTKAQYTKEQKAASWKERNLRGLKNAVDSYGLLAVLERSASN